MDEGRVREITSLTLAQLIDKLQSGEWKATDVLRAYQTKVSSSGFIRQRYGIRAYQQRQQIKAYLSKVRNQGSSKVRNQGFSDKGKEIRAYQTKVRNQGLSDKGKEIRAYQTKVRRSGLIRQRYELSAY